MPAPQRSCTAKTSNGECRATHNKSSNQFHEAHYLKNTWLWHECFKYQNTPEPWYKLCCRKQSNCLQVFSLSVLHVKSILWKVYKVKIGKYRPGSPYCQHSAHELFVCLKNKENWQEESGIKEKYMAVLLAWGQDMNIRNNYLGVEGRGEDWQIYFLAANQIHQRHQSP